MAYLRVLPLKRDKIGEAPLYYTWDGMELFHSDSMADLLAYRADKGIDEAAVYEYLYHQYVPGVNTVYKGIKKLLPGYEMVVADGDLKIDKYWDITENMGDYDAEFYAGELRMLLERVVEEKIGDNRDVGVFLSGGLDSSAIAAIAKKYTKGRLHTFAVGFEGFSELQYARRVACKLGAVHHEVLITAPMVMEHLPDIIRCYDEPIGDAATINCYLMDKRAKKYVDVVLSGDGGDEVFAGYPWHELALKWRIPFNMPWMMKRMGGKVLEFMPGKGMIGSRGNQLHWTGGVFFEDSLWDRQLFMEKALSLAEIDWLTTFDRRYPNAGIVLPDGMRHLLNKVQVLDIKNILAEKFCMKSFKAAKAIGLTVLCPFLDTRLVEFAFTVPPGYKIRHGCEKWILREAVRDLLPSDILGRKKQGFGTPLAGWLNTWEFGRMVANALLYGDLPNRMFRYEAVISLVDKIMSGEVRGFHEANAIWTVYALAAWHQVYVEED